MKTYETLKEAGVQTGDTVRWFGASGDTKDYELLEVREGTAHFIHKESGTEFTWDTDDKYGESSWCVVKHGKVKLKDLTEIEQLKLKVAFYEGTHDVLYYEEGWPYDGYTLFSGSRLDPELSYKLGEPKKPEFLPLKPETKYVDGKYGVWECIAVFGDSAYLARNKGDTGYVWNANTGENISQGGGEYNIVGVLK